MADFGNSGCYNHLSSDTAHVFNNLVVGDAVMIIFKPVFYSLGEYIHSPALFVG
jgi:hypothetical protein